MVYDRRIVHAIERDSRDLLGGKDLCGISLQVVSKIDDSVIHLIDICGIKVVHIGWLVCSQKSDGKCWVAALRRSATSDLLRISRSWTVQNSGIPEYPQHERRAMHL